MIDGDIPSVGGWFRGSAVGMVVRDVLFFSPYFSPFFSPIFLYLFAS